MISVISQLRICDISKYYYCTLQFSWRVLLKFCIIVSHNLSLRQYTLFSEQN